MFLTVYLLDGAQGLFIIPAIFIVVVILTLLVEGVTLYLFKYKPFRQSLFDAFVINVISLVVGLPFISTFERLSQRMAGNNAKAELPMILLLFYVQTVITEAIMLWLLNKTFPLGKRVAANLLMNMFSYLLIYLLLRYGIFNL